MMLKRKKELLNRIVAIMGVMSLFIVIWHGLNFMTIDDVESYTRIMMHEYYNQDNIDVLFSGASLCYRSFDTTILDMEFELNTFNIGSSSQTIDASYFLIKDCINRYDLNHVYLELSPIMAQLMDIDKRETSSMIGTYIISDYMKPSIDKFLFLLRASKPDYWINSFFLARRNWQRLFEPEYVGTLLQRKSLQEYKEYKYDFLQYENEWYAGKGYVESNIRVDEHKFYDGYGGQNISVEDINDKWFEYLKKIIDYCKNKDVELTLICTPLSEYFLVSHEKEYDDYHLILEEIAKSNEVEFWDFNLCKEDFFPLNAGLYMDAAHLNMYGADVFCKLFASIAKGEIKYEDVIYHTVSEKLESIPAGMCGIIKENNNIKVIANKEENFEYQIGIISMENEIIIQEFTHKNSIELPDDYHGSIHIIVRDKENSYLVEESFFV